MLTAWKVENFFNKCNNQQYYKFMQMDRERFHISEQLDNIALQIVDNDIHSALWHYIEEKVNLADIPVLELIEILNSVNEDNESINDSTELLQKFETVQMEYQAHCKKMNDFAYNSIYGGIIVNKIKKNRGDYKNEKNNST